MAELLLRGAQTLGELRSRAARMEPIADLAALKPIVDGLVGRKLMIELSGPGRGQVVSHNLYTEPEMQVLRAEGSHAGRATTEPEYAAPRRAPDDSVARLSGEVAELRDEVARLRERIVELESALSARSG